MFKRTNAQTPLAEVVDVIDPPTVEENEPLDTQLEQDPPEADSDSGPLVEDEALRTAAKLTAETDAVRDLILKLHPAIVPELINGDSVQALIASILPAHEAYSNIVANVQIPAGGNPQVEIDTESLTTDEKIRRGLAAYQRKA